MFERAELGFKRQFHSITFCILKHKSLKNQLFFNTKCHMGGRGGSEKCQKSVTYYLNGPLQRFSSIMILLNVPKTHAFGSNVIL